MRKHRLRRTLALLTLCVMLVSSLTVSASAAGFQDVPAGHWAAGEISRCVEHGFFQGQAPGHFGLGEPMTRSAFTVVLSRFFGWETPKPASPTYPDIPENAWYSGAVQAAYDHGALTRQRDTFRPTEYITREEMTVMLLRAMGYSDLAGLSAGMECPFEDVSQNQGYITLAYHLGLMKGTSATTFAPDRAATREQVAVIFMRLYDKLHVAAPETAVLLSVAETVPDLTSFDTAALPSLQLAIIGGNPAFINVAEDETTTAFLEGVQQSGTGTLLQVKASFGILMDSSKISDIAAFLAQAVTEGEYAGLLLDIPSLRASHTSAMTNLSFALDEALGDMPLYLVAEAPAWRDSVYDGYDYVALSSCADKLILRIQPYEGRSSSVAIAPPEPLENIYYALTSLKGLGIPSEKTALLLTSSATLWRGSNRTEDVLTAEDIQTLLDEGAMSAHYTDRYACSYLVGATPSNSSLSVWYLDGKSVTERLQMLHLFGVNAVWLTDPSPASSDFLAALQ